MKKYDVHVILEGKFHSVVIECTEFKKESGAYIFYRGGLPFSWYPIARTVIEEHKEKLQPIGQSGALR